MPGYKQLAQEIGEQVTSALKPLQDLSIEVLSNVAETVGEYVPAVNALPVRADEVVEANFDLVETIISNQKSYAKALLNALEPITGKLVDTPKPKTKVAAA